MPYSRLAEHLSSQASVAWDHSICSVLAAGECVLRETTLLRWYLALGAEEPGWGIQGTTFSCGHGKRTREKMGAGAAS